MNPARLVDFYREKLGDRPLIVVSNREPYQHIYDEGEIRCICPPSGLTVGLDPIMRATGGTWIAHGNGTADRAVVDKESCVAVPPERPAYRLKRVWLSKKLEANYYYGFANAALWPLCHVAYVRPTFQHHCWDAYVEANSLFADAVQQVAGDEPTLVFIQDYHLALLPRMIKERCPRATVVQFWHIPWPNPEVFRIFPWQQQLIHGMLGNDLLGFHIRYHCNNFIDTVMEVLEAKEDRERSAVIYQDRATFVRPFPISVDFDDIERGSAQPPEDKSLLRLVNNVKSRGQTLGIGVDRLDYTKGIRERLQAIDKLFDCYPELKGKFVYLQIGVPTRTHLPEYKLLSEQIGEIVESINWKHQEGAWLPIVYRKSYHSPQSLQWLYRQADLCLVTSLHDGMNLVAKEYVAAQVESKGALILSAFTGAARELTQAFIVNPYTVDEVVDAIHQALVLPEEHLRQRMEALRETVRDHNVFHWARKIIDHVSRIEKNSFLPATPLL